MRTARKGGVQEVCAPGSDGGDRGDDGGAGEVCAPNSAASEPRHARERAEAGLEPNIEKAFGHMRELAAIGLKERRRGQRPGAGRAATDAIGGGA